MKVKFECTFCGPEPCEYIVPMGHICSDKEIELVKEKIEKLGICPQSDKAHWNYWGRV